MPTVGIRQPIMADREAAEAHVKTLRTLCEQAERLREVAEELCKRLTQQIAKTQASLRQVYTPAPAERRRKARNKTR